MQPEISRRCLSCGAASRAGARFCPQCGQPLAAGVAGAESASDAVGEGRARTDAPSTREPEVPKAHVAEAPDSGARSTRETGAPRAAAPTTRDVYATAREREAPMGPTVAEGRAGVEAASAGTDAGVGPPGTGDGSAVAGGEAGDEAGDAGVEGRGRVARVREVTRERVGRMRDEALFALEEMPDDAGLRFVVVAVVLFLLSAFFLFLSVTFLR